MKQNVNLHRVTDCCDSANRYRDPVTGLLGISIGHANAAGAPILVAIERKEEGVWHMPPHSHSQGQLLGTFNGLVSVGIENHRRWVIPATHAMWVPPGMVHTVMAHGPFHGWAVFIGEQPCAQLPVTPRTFRVSGLLREAVSRAVSWSTDDLNSAALHVVDVIFDEICGLPEEPLGLPMPTDSRALRIALEFVADLTCQRTHEQWSEWAAIAPRTLTRLFVEQTGFNFGEWRQQAKLMKALEMLAIGEPITRIAIDVGYDNLSAFIAMFKKRFGITPGKFE